MLFQLIIDVAVAMFAAFGFYCALRAILDLLFVPKQISVAIEVQEKKDADVLDVLLHEASSAFFRQGRRLKIKVLISSALLSGTVGEDGVPYEKYLDWIQMYNAAWYAVDSISTE